MKHFIQVCNSLRFADLCGMKTASLLCCALFLVLCSCTNKKQLVEIPPEDDGYTIIGKTSNFMTGSQVFLEYIEGGLKAIRLDTAIIQADGSFKMEGKVENEGIGRIAFPRQIYNITIIKNANYLVEADGKAPRKTKVSGNPTANEFTPIWTLLNDRPLSTAEAETVVDTLKNPYSAFIVASNVRDLKEHIRIMRKSQQRLKNETSDSLFVSNINLILQQKEAEYEKNKATMIGAEAPDIVSKNPEGLEMKLSQLRGKVVLVDFWASWCGPCRRENPTVKKAWEAYQDKGFEVFGVSLDSSKDRWVKAIEKDGLDWEYNVSDLSKWNAQSAKDYGVQSIPSSFLLDQEGKIIAKNLRGAKLLSKLEELFPK